MQTKKKQEWTKGNTLQKAYCCKTLRIKPGNLPRYVKDGRLREVSVYGERYNRIVLWDVIQLLRKEHEQIESRSKELEQYLSHLTEIHFLYEELNSEPHQLNKDAVNIVNELMNGGHNG